MKPHHSSPRNPTGQVTGQVAVSESSPVTPPVAGEVAGQVAGQVEAQASLTPTEIFGERPPQLLEELNETLAA